ncbi:hypothetical protein ACCC92_05825 [Mucilaginibacter sp. Mucisp84]|uniref:hypothetical protein n=1 Tax=Mucilaginibacter sp. Mucisp84 TaxID=3243058 RepID=UPI0039A643EF
MKRIYMTKFSTVLVSAGLLFCVGLAAAMKYNQQQGKIKPAVQQGRKDTYDAALLARLNRLVGSMDLNNTCAYRAMVSMTSPADSVSAIRDIPVVFCREGQKCYYRYGPEEMINEGGFNVLISHEQKKVIIDRQKPVNAPVTGNLQDFAKGMVSEHYVLQSEAGAEEETILLKNEKHLTCRELAITYHKADEKVTRLFARLPDNYDPLDKGKDRTITMQITAWTKSPDWEAYPGLDRVIRIADGKIELTKKYMDYELINILK